MLRQLQVIVLAGVLLAGGCRAPGLPRIDQSVNYYASRPADVAPAGGVATPAARNAAGAGATAPAAAPTPPAQNPPSSLGPPAPGAPPVQTGQAAPATGVVLASAQSEAPRRKFDLHIPSEIPGAEAPQVVLPASPDKRSAGIRRVYPDLPPLMEEPAEQLSPAGKPYTLDELQRLAAANSPALRQAAADVENARGRLQQARTYANPVMGYGVQPNANNTAGSTQGGWIDQTINTAGKMKLAVASAEVDLSNSELAFRRARTDLLTQVRTAYYNLIVARETVRINRAMAHFTDEIFRLQTGLLNTGLVATHEPAALRSQVYVVRLAHRQAITNYVYGWKQLVAALGLPQMPLSAVEGQVDRFVPYYDYDAVLAHVLHNHTDILTSRNNLAQADYNLKLAQVTPIPNLDVIASMWQETQVVPQMQYHQMSVSAQVPLWDWNKGNIRAATGARARAAEGPRQIEVTLTNNLANAYGAYQDNLAAVDYYRRSILPDQVRYYRGVFLRRETDPNAAFNDLVTAQQTLVGSVTTYLGVLGQLWTSIITVADLLQTDDLYQLGSPQSLPPLPEFEDSQFWNCPTAQSNGALPGPQPLAAAGRAATPPATIAPAAAPASSMPAPQLPPTGAALAVAPGPFPARSATLPPDASLTGGSQR